LPGAQWKHAVGKESHVLAPVREEHCSLCQLRIAFLGAERDDLSALPGLRERWAISVLHCFYCHGYEVADGA
jgi:hypothetical protein